MADTSPASLAKQLLGILYKDGDRLERIDNYLHGEHDDPYMPETADDEYKMLAKRAVSNWMPLLVGTPAQALCVDGFRRGRPGELPVSGAAVLPEWDHWERSGLGARQTAVYRGALTYGHAFTLTEKVKGGRRVVTKGLSALKTAALFEDPANDLVPFAALTIVTKPLGEIRGVARMWDRRNEYRVTFKSLSDLASVVVQNGRRHGSSECPVTRFAAMVDLEGRTVGVIEPMIELQNRINQTVFDLLIAQTGGSFKVRYASGMAPPVYRDPETGEPILDEHGNPKPLPINLNAKRFLFSDDSDVKFGTLDETPLGGYIESIDMSIRHLAAISQTPPHHLLGQIANLSAEALLAAETALSRKIEEFRRVFSEAWERVFRLAAELAGETLSADDWHGEVLWRDMEQRSLAQSADALGKLADQLNVPKRGLWRRIPGVTQNEIDDWEELREEEDAELQLAQSIRRATTPAPAVQFSDAEPVAA
ncbi:phage portal protein [Saccharothrix sp. HUAS TT1]|uniref:phage portal protein n=1 Tax=unclassified Saccharothrix TaxID=2593673 RepID=UPI00345B8584